MSRPAAAAAAAAAAVQFVASPLAMSSRDQ